MNINCFVFGAVNIVQKDIEDKKVIEAGSYDVNGSLRQLFEKYNPKEYVGVDISEGPGVDLICKVEGLIEKFGENSFDLVISTELLEHVLDWKSAIHNLKLICKPGGIILLTTRSLGFIYHGYPFDFWRYEPQDMEYIFGDCRIEKLEIDPQKGVFIKAVKPVDFKEKELAGYELYSIVSGARVKEIADKDLNKFSFRSMVFKQRLKEFLHKQIDKIL